MEVFFTKENCCRSMYDTSVESNQNCIAILKPEVLGEELRSKDNQLVLLLSGFGCRHGMHIRHDFGVGLESSAVMCVMLSFVQMDLEQELSVMTF